MLCNRWKDLSRVALNDEIRFRIPLNQETLVGRTALQAYLDAICPPHWRRSHAQRLRERQMACLGGLDLTKPHTTNPALEFFELKDGKLLEIRP